LSPGRAKPEVKSPPIPFSPRLGQPKYSTWFQFVKLFLVLYDKYSVGV